MDEAVVKICKHGLAAVGCDFCERERLRQSVHELRELVVTARIVIERGVKKYGAWEGAEAWLEEAPFGGGFRQAGGEG